MENFISKQENKNNFFFFFRFLLIFLLLSIIIFLVYLTNGSMKGYLHFIYLPIILAGYYWRVKGGVIVAIISGLLLGPFMPLDVSQGIMQSPNNWLFRLFVFIVIGNLVGYLFSKIEKLNKKSLAKILIHPSTEIYNTTKFLLDLEQRLKAEEKFTVVSYKLTNIKEMEKYNDFSTIIEIVKNIIQEIESFCSPYEIYSSGMDELILITTPNCSDYFNKISHIINKYKSPVMIENTSFRLVIKVGIYEYNGGNESPEEIFNKVRIAYEQGEANESGIYFYNDELSEHRKDIFEISISIQDAIKNGEFFLVYQPKIDIINETISGVEVLIRWNRGNKKPVRPDVLIPIAVEIGFISEISKFVIDTATDQMMDWETKGIGIECSINLTTTEMLDVDFYETIKQLMDRKMIDRSNYEIELSERSIYENSHLLSDVIKVLQEKGYKISIDDFGSGYNSLKVVGLIPFDIIKIDKYYVDHLDQIEVKELVCNIINFVHKFDKTAIAEGVETEEQLKILKELHCDKVQGYYFSKPLLAYDFEKYYQEFYKNKIHNAQITSG